MGEPICLDYTASLFDRQPTTCQPTTHQTTTHQTTMRGPVWPDSFFRRLQGSKPIHYELGDIQRRGGRR